MFQNAHRRINYCQKPCWEKLLRVCYQVSHQVTATPWKEFQLAGASRGEFPSQAAAPGPEPGTATVSRAVEQSREFSSFMRDQIIFTLCRGRAARVMDWARSWGREWILDNIENLNKMFIPLLTSNTHVTITWALISAQGLLHRPFIMFCVNLNMYVLIYEQMKIHILI